MQTFLKKNFLLLTIFLCVGFVSHGQLSYVEATTEIEPGESGPQGPTVNPPATTTPSTAVAPATPSSGGFVPLTNLPGLPDDTGKRTLADYINVLFRLSIGIGALIAVIKITFAGIKYMGTDSFSSKEEAKKDITSALLGLLIMLSTVVILQLIYPDILNINVLQKLEPVGVSTSQQAVQQAKEMVDVSEADRAARAAATAQRGETSLFALNIENSVSSILSGSVTREQTAFKERCDAREGRTERTAIWKGAGLTSRAVGYDMVCWGREPSSGTEPH